MKNLIKISISSVFLLILIASSCKKKTDSPTPSSTTSTSSSNGVLYFHLHTDIDTNEYSYGDTIKNADGRKMTISIAQLYISGVKLYKTDGTSVSVPGFVLKNIDSEQFIVGSAPAGNYSYVSFNVGLDSLTNSKDPSIYSTSNPLGSHTPSMWFGSTQKGYIFVNVKGTIDTSAAKNGKADYPFSFQIGSNALLQSVTMSSSPFTIYPNSPQEVHLNVDYAKLLKGLDLKTENMTDTYLKNPSVASKVAKNISSMFSYEK